MVELLNTPEKRAQIKKILPKFDDAWNIAGAEFKKYVPSFVGKPTIGTTVLDKAETWVNVTAKLDNYGWIFGVAINTEAANYNTQ